MPTCPAALAGNMSTILTVLMASPAKPATVQLVGSSVMMVRAALGRMALPPQPGEGLVLAYMADKAEIGIAAALRDAQGPVTAALRDKVRRIEGGLVYRTTDREEECVGEQGLLGGYTHAITEDKWYVEKPEHAAVAGTVYKHFIPHKKQPPERRIQAVGVAAAHPALGSRFDQADEETHKLVEGPIPWTPDGHTFPDSDAYQAKAAEGGVSFRSAMAARAEEPWTGGAAAAEAGPLPEKLTEMLRNMEKELQESMAPSSMAIPLRMMSVPVDGGSDGRPVVPWGMCPNADTAGTCAWTTNGIQECTQCLITGMRGVQSVKKVRYTCQKHGASVLVGTQKFWKLKDRLFPEQQQDGTPFPHMEGRRLTLSIPCALAGSLLLDEDAAESLWECYVAHRREGMAKVQDAFYRDLMHPFRDTFRKWKRELRQKFWYQKDDAIGRAVAGIVRRVKTPIEERLQLSTGVEALRDAVLHIFHVTVEPHVSLYEEALARFADTISVDWTFASSARVHVVGPRPGQHDTTQATDDPPGPEGQECDGEHPDGDDDEAGEDTGDAQALAACTGDGSGGTATATRARGTTRWRVAPCIATVVGRYGFILQCPMLTGHESGANLAWVLDFLLCKLKGHLRERGPGASHPIVITVDNLRTHQHTLQKIIDVHFPLLKKGVVRFAVDPWHFASRVTKTIPSKSVHQDGKMMSRLWFDTVHWIRTPPRTEVSSRLMLPERDIDRQLADLSTAREAIQGFKACAHAILARKPLSQGQQGVVKSFLAKFGWAVYGPARAVGAAARLRKHVPLALAAVCAAAAGMLHRRSRGQPFTVTAEGVHEGEGAIPMLPLHVGPDNVSQAQAELKRVAKLFEVVWAPPSESGATSVVRGAPTHGILEKGSPYALTRSRVKASCNNLVGIQGLMNGRDAVHGATTTGGNESLHAGMRDMVTAGTSTRLDVAKMNLTLYWLERNQATAAKLLSKYTNSHSRKRETRSKAGKAADSLDLLSALCSSVTGLGDGEITAALQRNPVPPAPPTFEEVEASGLPLYHRATSSVTPELEHEIRQVFLEEQQARKDGTCPYSERTLVSRVASAAHATEGQVRKVAQMMQAEAAVQDEEVKTQKQSGAETGHKRAGAKVSPKGGTAKIEANVGGAKTKARIGGKKRSMGNKPMRNVPKRPRSTSAGAF